MSVDQTWTLFVRQWRNLMSYLFMPLCSRSGPCCEMDCASVAEHFSRTGDVP